MKSPTLFLLGKIWSPRTFCAGTSPGTSPGDGFAGKKQTSRYTFSGVSGTAAHRDGFRQMCRRNLQCRPRDTAVGLWNENENILFSESPRQERRVFLHFPPILRGRFRFRSCLQAILLTRFKSRRFFFTSSCIQLVIRRPRNFFPFVHRRERFASFAHRPEAPTPRGKDDFGASEETFFILYHCLWGWGHVS